MRTMPSDTEMYGALVERDSSYEGLFVAAIRTTGIFCRPTCPARKPLARNVEYFATGHDAIHAGYRPCKRCCPMDRGPAPPPWAERLTRAVERAPTRRLTDDDLRAMSIDPAGARRYFKVRYGMTFHAYHRARRMGLALAEVGSAGPGPAEVDAVGLRHGFRSSSGFRDAFGRLFREPPGRGRRTRCLRARWLDTPLGAMLAVAGDKGLTLLEFVDRRRVESEILALRARMRAVIVPGSSEHLERIADELAAYFCGTLRRFEVTLDVAGTPFQQLVWNRLRRIPHGETLSYGQLAEEIGRPGGQRAVGLANGRNCLTIVVPCHRVIRADGSLGGYGGGRWRKQWLLELEQNGPPTDRPHPVADPGTRAPRPANR